MPSSTYIRNCDEQLKFARNNKILSEKQQCAIEINQARMRIDQAIYQMNSQRKPHMTGHTGLAIAFVIGITIVILLLAGRITFSAILVGIIVGIALWFIGKYLINQRIDEYNQEIDRKVSQYEADFQREKAAIEKKHTDEINKISISYNQELEKERRLYLSRAAEYRKKYGGHSGLKPLVVWLVEQFDKEILAAERDIYAKEIRAHFQYRIEQTGIIVIKNMPTSEKKKEECFVFMRNSIQTYNNIPNFMERVGLAQALSKLVEFEIKKKYPQDPIAPSNFRPEVKTVDYDDSFIELMYTVVNPRYKAPIRI